MDNKALFRAIKRLKDDGKSYADIANILLPQFPVSRTKPAVYKFFIKHEPIRQNDLRVALELPRLLEVEACPTCGYIHTHDCETHKLADASAVTVEPCPQCGEIHDMLKTCKKDRRTRHRIAISKTNPASAARSIVRNCDYTAEELIKELEEL